MGRFCRGKDANVDKYSRTDGLSTGRRMSLYDDGLHAEIASKPLKHVATWQEPRKERRQAKHVVQCHL